MACDSIISLLRGCADGVVAGVEKFYIVSYLDLSANTSTQLTYSADTGGTITQVFLDPGKKFVEVELLKSTAGLKDVATIDPTKGLNFFTQSFTLVLGDLTAANFQFVQNVKNQPVAMLYKSRTEKWFVIGLNGQLILKTAEGGTGTAESDLIGYTLTFEGISKTPAPILTTTLVSTLIS